MPIGAQWTLTCKRNDTSTEVIIFLDRPLRISHEQIPVACNDAVVDISTAEGVELGLGFAVLYKDRDIQNAQRPVPIRSTKCTQRFDEHSSLTRTWTVTDYLKNDPKYLRIDDGAAPMSTICLNRKQLGEISPSLDYSREYQYIPAQGRLQLNRAKLVVKSRYPRSLSLRIDVINNTMTEMSCDKLTGQLPGIAAVECAAAKAGVEDVSFGKFFQSVALYSPVHLCEEN
jgi:hypothetical protein